MKKLYFGTIVIFLLFLIIGCSSSRLTIIKVDSSTSITSQKAIEYETFWEAMKNIDLSFHKSSSLDIEHQNFANALKSVVEGDLVNAENLLKELYSSNDSLIRNYSKSILINILFSQSKWQSLHSLNLDTNDTTESYVLLAKAFKKAPKEIHSFPPHVFEVPTSRSLSGVPIIEVEINGHKKKFWLDTGAGLSAVASDVAKKCNILPLDGVKIEAGTSTSKKIEIQPAVINEFKIGEMLIKNHPIIIFDKRVLEFKLFGLIRILKIDGIIGWNAIKNMEVEINCKNKFTSIKKPSKCENSNSKRNLFWLDVPIVKLATNDGIPLYFFLDTGANKTSITQNIFKKIKIENIRTKKTITGGAGGFERIEKKIVSDFILSFNDYNLNFKEIGAYAKDHAEFLKLDGMLGNDIAKNGIIKIDYLNGIFELKLNKESHY